MSANSAPLWSNSFWLHLDGGHTFLAEILDRLPIDDEHYALLRVRPRGHVSLQGSQLRDQSHPELTLFREPCDIFSGALPLEASPAESFEQISAILLSWEFNGHEPDLNSPSCELQKIATQAMRAAWERLSDINHSEGRIACRDCHTSDRYRCGFCRRQTCSHRTAWEGSALLCDACYATLWIRDLSGTGIRVGAERPEQRTRFVCTQETSWNSDHAFIHDTLHPDAVLQERVVIYDDWYDYYLCPHCQVLFYERVTK